MKIHILKHNILRYYLIPYEEKEYFFKKYKYDEVAKG